MKDSIPTNLKIYPKQDNVAPFYNEASLVLNLSDKNQVIETFGLTALEAMSCALPVIVPSVGGIAEMVEDGVTGYKIDVQNLNEIESKIKDIFEDKSLYIALSKNAYTYSQNYNEDNTINQVIDILDS